MRAEDSCRGRSFPAVSLAADGATSAGGLDAPGERHPCVPVLPAPQFLDGRSARVRSGSCLAQKAEIPPNLRWAG
jgi:hypothetical protein